MCVCVCALTVGALYGLEVELLVLLEAADVSLLLQLLGAVEHVLLRGFVGNHVRGAGVLSRGTDQGCGGR